MTAKWQYKQAYEAALEHNHELAAENAKLREEFNKMDVWHSKELTAAMDENAKLRELVRGLVYATHPADRARLIADAAEFGIEVDG